MIEHGVRSKIAARIGIGERLKRAVEVIILDRAKGARWN